KFYYGSHLKNVLYGKQDFGTNSLVNSGMLITVDSFRKVGGYNEKVKLDFSDHQFIEDYKQKYKQFVLVESTCIQSFSAIEDSKEKQIIRFRYYCEGVYNFKAKSRFAKVLMIPYLFFKAMKKSLKFRSLMFFQIFFNEMVKKTLSL